MATCVWCGFDRLEETAELCAVCGQTPDSGSVTLEMKTADREPTAQRQGTPPLPRVDRVFGGRYRIESVVGRGGMGAVFRVIDERDHQTYALKVLHSAPGENAWSLKRFQREAEVLARIAHPAVPRIHDFGVVERSMYLVTDFIEGSNLRDVIGSKGALPLADVTRIGAEVAECLNAAHQHGVVHRDVKPHNVMLTPAGEVRLIDFGVARDAALNATNITGTGFTVGTPHYMAPEQFHGGRVDARCDIYSLGVLLFEAATGRLPFYGETHIAVGMKHAGEAPPHPRAIRPDVPMLLNRVILKCLEKNPADRYPTAADVAHDLRRAGVAKRTVKRTRAGDFEVHEDTGEDWALVIASQREKSEWSAGMTLQYGGQLFKLQRVDYDTTYPSPFIYRFTFTAESEVIRRFVDYDTPEPPPTSRISRWFGKKQ